MLGKYLNRSSYVYLIIGSFGTPPLPALLIHPRVGGSEVPSLELNCN
jgi:hypothetical protein